MISFPQQRRSKSGKTWIFNIVSTSALKKWKAEKCFIYRLTAMNPKATKNHYKMWSTWNSTLFFLKNKKCLLSFPPAPNSIWTIWEITLIPSSMSQTISPKPLLQGSCIFMVLLPGSSMRKLTQRFNWDLLPLQVLMNYFSFKLSPNSTTSRHKNTSSCFGPRSSMEGRKLFIRFAGKNTFPKSVTCFSGPIGGSRKHLFLSRWKTQKSTNI